MENFMPRGVYERQHTANHIVSQPDQTGTNLLASGEEVSVAPKLVAMKLLRHYRPVGDYEVVGYLKKEVTKKFPDGQIKVVEPEEFIPGEKAPPPFPGVLNENKVWAGTTIKVPEDEGKTMKRHGIAERDFDD
jgi:hypothetical protein